MNYIIFDLEATCWDTEDEDRPNETIEIGAVKLDDNLNTVSEFDIFIKPVMNPTLSEFCKKLTSISQKDIDDADTFPKAVERFREWVCTGDDYILCSWGRYDKFQLAHDCGLHGLDSSWITDYYVSIKHIYAKKTKSKRVGFNRVLQQCGLEFEGTPHRGIDDAKNIARVFVQKFEIFRGETSDAPQIGVIVDWKNN
ncbi:MAG: 3'-5' exonuclease [Thermoplasmata archaeon HGW-Thermoplasmata-1]|nr:MAG: 3'-5' exonuclease [Thermoplasmata archaeon HGW-Thermoplasmata-1]